MNRQRFPDPKFAARLLSALSFALFPGSVTFAQGPRPDAATIARAVDSLAALAVADGLAPALGVAEPVRSKGQNAGRK